MKRYTIFYLLLLIFTGTVISSAQIVEKNLPKNNSDSPNSDNPPEISGVPDQIAALGQSFRVINLWNYTRELDGDEVSFYVTGGVFLSASIDSNSLLVVTAPNPNFIGSERLIITVQDLTLNQYFDTDTVIYTVREEDNAPILGDIPNQAIGINGNFTDIDLNDYYYEYDGDQVAWKFNILTSPGSDPNPEWTFEPVGFTDQMTITADVISNGRPANDSGQLAAFINGQIRGIATASLVGDKMRYVISIYNNNDGDTISFRFYDELINKELPVLQKLIFTGQGIPSNPENDVRLDAGNIIIQKQNNLLKIFRPDSSWSGSETAEIRVEDLGTAAQLHDSAFVGFTVYETTLDSIPAPSNVVAEAAGTENIITWDDNSSNETHFIVERKDAQIISEFAYHIIATVGADTESYVDRDIVSSKTYTYRVYAVNDETRSGYSNTATVKSDDFVPPGAPTGFNGEPYNKRVELSWNANEEPDLAGYILYKTTIGEETDSFATVGKEITHYSVTGLENSVAYAFMISSYDTSGNISERSDSIFVTPYNHAPENTLAFDSLSVQEDDEPDTLNNISEYFYDADNDTLDFYASSSDSSLVVPVILGDKIVLNYQPNAHGDALITVFATDRIDSAVTSFNINISSVNDAPVLVTPFPNVEMNEDVGEITAVTNVSTYFNDVDEDELTYSVDVIGTIIQSRISNDSIYISTVQDKFGGAKVVVTASDGSLSVSDTIDVTVNPVNDPPVIAGVPEFIFNEDDSLVVYLNQYVTDVDNDTTELMFDAVVLSASSGTPVENVNKSRDDKGNLTIEVGTGDLIISINQTTNVATFRATSDSSGSFNVQFTAYDLDESYDRDTIEVTVNPVNDAPYLKIPVSDRVILEDAGEIVVSSSLYNIFGDIDSEILQFNAQSNGSVISARVSGDSLFIKTADDLNGSNNVIVTAYDGQYTVSDTFVVNVIPVNDPPVLTLPVADKVYMEDMGTVTAVNDLKVHFSDVDGDTLSFSVFGSGINTTAEIINDALVITGLSDKFGTDTLILTAYDNQFEASDTLQVTLLPVNDAPVLSGMPDISFNEDDSTTLYLNNYVYDVDNDTTQISFMADVLTASGEKLSENIRRYKDEKGNSVIEVGTGDLLISIDDVTNVAFIKASADSNGLFTVKFTAIDDSNAVDSDTIDVRVHKVNDPPYLASPLQDAVFPEDAGTQLVNGDLKLNFRDVDLDVLSFSVTSSSGPVDAFISGDSLFVTTIEDLYGTDTLVVTAYDGQYQVSDTLLVNIYPLNDAPVLYGLPDISFDEDDSTSLGLNPFVYDVDNDTTQITFTANVISASNPALLSGIKRYKDEKGNSVIEVGTGDLIITIDDSTNTASFKASPDSNGVFTVEFIAADDSLASDRDTILVNVNMINDPPYVYLPVADTTFLEDVGNLSVVSDLKQHFKDVDFDQLIFSVTTTGIVNAAVTNDNLSVSTIENLYGVDTLVITASDGQYSVKDTILVNILAVNDAPVLAGLPDISFNEDDSTTINLNSYVSDVDNDTTQINFTANVFSASNPSILRTVKKFRDKFGYNVIEVGTGDLVIRIDSVTNIAYISSSPDSNGVFGVEFTAIDDSLDFSSDTIDVFLNPVNDPPYIFAVIPDTSFLEDAGEHLIVPDLKYHFRDVDFDTLSFSIAVLDTVINAELRNDSLFIATKPDYFGLSAIKITASDWQYFVVDTIFVNVLAVNDPPVLSDIPDISFNEDDSLHLYLNEYLFDVDNDTTQLYFTFTVERIDLPPVKVKKSAAIIDEEETVTGKPLVNSANSQALIINIDSLTHKATFSSGPDSNGVFRVVFTVTDDSGAVAFDSLTVNINPVNDAPVKMATIKDTTFLEDSGPIVMAPNIYDIFRDIDNPSLDFVVQFSEPGIQYSIIDSVFTIEPDSHFNGNRTAYIFASDGEYTVSDTFNIFVRSVNDQPRVSDIPPIIMPEDTIYRFDLDQYVYDPDHDTTELVWMADIIRNTQLENSVRKLNKKALIADEDFTVYQSDNKTVLKTAADSLIITINTSTHIATIVATLNFSGLNIPVVFTARDPLSLAGNDTTSISVIERNDPPVITGSIPQLTLNEDDSLQVLYTSFYPYISDPETPDSLLGIFATYSGNNFTITHTPFSIQLKPKPNWFGIDTIYLSVTDFIDTVTALVRVRVNAVNDLPYFINLPDSVRFRGDSSVTIPLWDYVEDLETPDSLMLFSFNRNNDSLLISYTASNGNLRLSSLWNFGGVVRLIITARDQGNALVRDSIFVFIDKFVGVDDENIIPEVYSLSQNYPNPFNPSTVIRFGLPKEDNVELSLYNISGERVRTLVSEHRNAGVHTVTWDGRNDYGNQLPSGIYFYKMKTSAFNEVKKLIMIK